ncbi:MAG: hypothetical protein ACKOXB_05820 [Flavobacteriales bacterium]
MRKKTTISFFALTITCILLVFNGSAQDSTFRINIHFTYPTQQIEKNTFPTGIYSPLNIDREMKKSLLKLYDQGFVAASVDSVSYLKDSAHVYLHTGERYIIKKIDLSGIDPLFLRSAGVKEKELRNLPFNNNLISSIGLKLIAYTENHGYPFASVYLDDIVFSGNEVSGKLKMVTNDVVKISEIIIHGDAKLNPKYIYNYLAVRPGDLYKEKVLASIDTRLKELPFVTVKNPSAISFTTKGVIIHLFIDHRKSSSFNGVVGILPNNSSTTGSTGQSSIAFTGDITMHLSNLVKQGEVTDLKWRGLPNKTQELDLKLNYPFLFSLPVGINGSLNLFKQDTSFINYNSNIGLSYLFTGNNYIKAFVNNKGTNILNPEKNVAIQSNIQNNTTSYGIELYQENLDYRLNPTKGYNFLLTTQVGSKTISGAKDGYYNLEVKSNDSVSGFIKIPATSIIYNLSGRGDVYFPFFSVTTLKLGLQGGWLINPYLFNNDLYRLGGIRTMRGFTDASLYVSKYLIGTAEYRFLLERNSFISAFFDYAYTEKITMTERIIDHPFGFGAGFSFETKAGIFSLNYAIGRQLDNPIDFSAAKIHFGFLNQF